MREPIIFFLVLFNYILNAQNLIVNSSFEDTLACPNNFAQLNSCYLWNDPTGASSDCFSSCTINPIVSTPFNYFGYSQPFSGDAYSGLILYSKPTINFPIIREYIMGTLSQSLLRNRKYCYEFKINLADSSNYSINSVGIAFSDTMINISSFSNLTITPKYETFNFINDTSSWVTISSSFIAGGNERYIVIGNFLDNNTTDTIKIRNGSQSFDIAYYYIDDVSLVECDENPSIPNVFSPNGDEINDLFRIENLPPQSAVIIYNRWGIKVFESKNNNTFWDGKTTSGIDCTEGAYFYLIQTEKENYKGYLQLIR